MKVLLSSKSYKKINALKKALEYLNINDYELECFKVASDVSENPLDEETLQGAKNRNNNLKKLEVPYDMLVSIEGGFTEDNNGKYYIDTYVVVNYNNEDFVGISPRVKITKKIYEYVKNGNMLHLLIQKLQNTDTDEGAVGFITNNRITRTEIELSGVIDALNKALNLNVKNEICDVENNIDDSKLEELENNM